MENTNFETFGDQDFIKRAYTVIIEWDGQRPPTKWYNRCLALGLTVRGTGNSEVSPLTRRQDEKSHGSFAGIIHQEGAIFCNSESEARALGHMARELGAKAVTVTSSEILDLGMTEEDEKIMRRIQATLGKRGRPAPVGKYVITCHDEMESFEVAGKRPVNCPHCRSFNVNIREGEQTLVYPVGSSLTEMWLNMHFQTFIWENPRLCAAVDPIAAELKLSTIGKDAVVVTQEPIVELLFKSTLMNQIESALLRNDISQERALRLMDYGFSALRFDNDKRVRNRLNAVADWFKQGNKGNGFVLYPKPNDVDFLDIVSFDPTILNVIKAERKAAGK